MKIYVCSSKLLDLGYDWQDAERKKLREEYISKLEKYGLTFNDDGEAFIELDDSEMGMILDIVDEFERNIIIGRPYVRNNDCDLELEIYDTYRE